MDLTKDVYVATQHWQHKDWTVYNEQCDEYRLRGLTEIEAIEQAEALNAQLR